MATVAVWVEKDSVFLKGLTLGVLSYSNEYMGYTNWTWGVHKIGGPGRTGK